MSGSSDQESRDSNDETYTTKTRASLIGEQVLFSHTKPRGHEGAKAKFTLLLQRSQTATPIFFRFYSGKRLSLQRSLAKPIAPDLSKAVLKNLRHRAFGCVFQDLLVFG